MPSSQDFQLDWLRAFVAAEPAPAVAADLDRIRGLVERARTFAHAGRYREANKLLAEAHETVVSALNKMLASATLVYDLKFKSAAEEFDYEIARYRSYEELIPIAYAELKPSGGAVNLSERYVKESRATRDIAQQQAARGDYRSAIKTLQEATGRLQTALRAVGLVVPEAIQALLRRVVGPHRAERLMVAGAMVEAEQAHAIGLVDELAEPEVVVEQALQWFAALAPLPREPLLATRAIARADLHAALAGFSAEQLAGFVEQWYAASTQQALQALVSRLRK